MSHLHEYVQGVAKASASFDEFKEKVQSKDASARLRVLDHGGTCYGLMFRQLDDQTHQNAIEREAIGSVFDKETHRMLCRATPLMREHTYYGTASSWDALTSELPTDLNQHSVRVYTEGTRMMVYHHKEEWRVSTCRVIDAGRGRWLQGSRTFRDQFEAALHHVGASWDDLRTDRAYTFLVCSPETPSVVPFTTPFLLLLSTFNPTTLEFENEMVANIPTPTMVSIRGLEDLRVYLDVTASSIPGVVITRPGTGESIKIMHAEHMRARQLLGNSPSMLRRALELLRGPHETLREFERTFPHLRPEVQRTRQRMFQVSRWLMDVYRAKYIRRCAPVPAPGDPATFLPTPVHRFLVQLHEAYKVHQQKYQPATLRHMLLRLPANVMEKVIELSESSAALYSLGAPHTTTLPRASDPEELASAAE